MRDANNVIDVTERELEHLVCENGAGVGESKEGVICEDGFEAHCFGVEDCFVAEGGEGCVGVDDGDTFADHDVAEDGEEGEDCGEGGFSLRPNRVTIAMEGRCGGAYVEDEKWDHVDLRVSLES